MMITQTYIGIAAYLIIALASAINERTYYGYSDINTISCWPEMSSVQLKIQRLQSNLHGLLSYAQDGDTFLVAHSTLRSRKNTILSRVSPLYPHCYTFTQLSSKYARNPSEPILICIENGYELGDEAILYYQTKIEHWNFKEIMCPVVLSSRPSQHGKTRLLTTGYSLPNGKVTLTITERWLASVSIRFESFNDMSFIELYALELRPLVGHPLLFRLYSSDEMYLTTGLATAASIINVYPLRSDNIIFYLPSDYEGATLTLRESDHGDGLERKVTVPLQVDVPEKAARRELFEDLGY